MFTHKDLLEKFGVGRSSVIEILTRKELFRDKFTQISGLPTMLTYDKNKFLSLGDKRVYNTNKPKYLSTVMQFIDLNDVCTFEYKSQKQQTTIDKFFCKASQ